MFSCLIFVFEIDIVRGRLLTVYIDHEAFPLSCRVFVVIRNGMKSVFMCECDLYGWVCFSRVVTFVIKTWFIFVVTCVHIIRPDERHH